MSPIICGMFYDYTQQILYCSKNYRDEIIKDFPFNFFFKRGSHVVEFIFAVTGQLFWILAKN